MIKNLMVSLATLSSSGFIQQMKINFLTDEIRSC